MREFMVDIRWDGGIQLPLILKGFFAVTQSGDQSFPIDQSRIDQI
jgi:hypothetical protein